MFRMRELFSVALAGEVLPVGASVFAPLSPTRVFDTRPGTAAPGPKGLVGAGATIDVQVAGAGGVPADATAVVLNVTATGAVAPGFVTVWPAGAARPLASSLNLTRGEQTRPNMVIVPLGAGGTVSLFSEAGTHLLADVTGYFSLAAGPVAGGRILPLPPERVFDTRPGTAAPGPKGLVATGATLTAQVGGVAGVPLDAAAVVMNITAVQAVAEGFVTVWPTGRPRPEASTLNVTPQEAAAPNTVIMPLGADGRLDFYADAGVHLLADVTGYVTAASAPAGISGLFVPLAPARVFDTRASGPAPAPGPTGRLAAGATITAQITGLAGVPAGAGLVALNVTATDADTGYVTAYPGPEMPVVSALNLNGPGDTRANASVTPLAPDGRLRLFAFAATHLLVDANGYTLP